ncbi:MAG: 6-hydroxy-D-nicotine oxidase, partial [Caldilineaceae bacterium]|nr:6-hydroxy-D-nicotine oxidase [Caldilineaceae bacterium]
MTANQASAQPTLRIQLIGGFRLLLDATPIRIRSTRLQSLLTCLTLQRHAPISRQQLAFLFWPESTESQARTNLRQLLHHLHQTVPDSEHFLLDDGQSLAWRADATVASDVADFEAALARVANSGNRRMNSQSRQALTQAVDLYQGDLAPDCYDDWIEAERESLRRQYVQALGRLIHLLENERSYAKAIDYARKLTQADPLDEDGWRTLMRLYALDGRRSDA